MSPFGHTVMTLCLTSMSALCLLATKRPSDMLSQATLEPKTRSRSVGKFKTPSNTIQKHKFRMASDVEIGFCSHFNVILGKLIKKRSKKPNYAV